MSVANLSNPAASRLVHRRYMLHAPGFLYIITTLVLVAGAINGQNNVLFLIFGLAVGGLIISGILSGANLMGIAVSREASPSGVAGESFTLRYRITNRNWFLPACGLVIEELPPDSTRAMVMLTPALSQCTMAGKSSRAATDCLAHARGIARFNRFRVVSTFPFGLTKKSVTFESQFEVCIRPARRYS